MRAPLLWLAVPFAAGIVLAGVFGAGWLVPAAFLAILFSLVTVIAKRDVTSIAAPLVAMFFAGIFACSLRERAIATTPLNLFLDTRPVYVSARVVLRETPEWDTASGPGYSGRGWYSSTTAEVRELETEEGWKQLPGRVRLHLRAETPLAVECGDLLELYGLLQPVSPATNPGQPDRRAFWHRRGIEYSLSVSGAQQVTVREPGHGYPLRRFADRLRRRLRNGLEYGVGESAGRRLLVAMTLGYRKGVARDLSVHFRHTNTVHILAISGLHVGFIFLLVNILLTWCGVSRRARAVGAMLCIAAYAIVTGCRLPVVRASVMFVSFLIAPLLGREQNSYNSLGLAAMILLIINPLFLFDPGFQLSFSAVLAIIYFAGALESRFHRLWPCGPEPGQLLIVRAERIRWRIGKWLALLLGSSCAAWLGCAPLIAYHFNMVSLLGVVANLLVIPAGFTIVGLGVPSMLLSLLSPVPSIWLNRAAVCVASLMNYWVRMCGTLSWGYFPVRSPNLVHLIIFYLLLFLMVECVVRQRVSRLRGILAGATLLFWLLPSLFSMVRPEMEMVFLDVSQGDSTYIEFPSGENLLVDGGPGTGRASAAGLLVPFLHSRARESLDMVLLTHPHSDHLSGLGGLLREISVRRLAVAQWETESAPCDAFLKEARKRGMEIIPVRRGDILVRGPGLRMRVLNPGNELHYATRSDLNNNSVALMVEYGRFRALLCADMEQEAEHELCTLDIPLNADILRAGHHGSATSSTEEFLRHVAPRWAIISAGVNNRFGHPAPSTIARLKTAGIGVLRSDEDGAITVKTDGISCTLETCRTNRFIRCNLPAPPNEPDTCRGN